MILALQYSLALSMELSFLQTSHYSNREREPEVASTNEPYKLERLSLESPSRGEMMHSSLQDPSVSLEHIFKCLLAFILNL